MIFEPVISGTDHDSVLSDSIRVRNPFPEHRRETDQSRLNSSFNSPGISASWRRSSGSHSCCSPRWSIRQQHHRTPFLKNSKKAGFFGNPGHTARNSASKAESGASEAAKLAGGTSESVAPVCHEAVNASRSDASDAIISPGMILNLASSCRSLAVLTPTAAKTRHPRSRQ